MVDERTPVGGGGAPGLPGRRGRWRLFLRENGRYLLSALLSAVLTVVLILLPVDYGALGDFGYLGIMLTSVLANATVVFPAPTMAAAWIGGTFLIPPLVGLAAGFGSTVGEMTGYLAGYGGSALAARSRYYEQVRRFVGKYGVLGIFVLAVIPSPLFDLAGLAAGAMRMRLWMFLGACFLGKTFRYVLVAYLGRWGSSWLLPWLSGSQFPMRIGRFG